MNSDMPLYTVGKEYVGFTIKIQSFLYQYEETTTPSWSEVLVFYCVNKLAD